MKAVLNLTTYQDICNAVREKKSETDTYLASELPEKIRSIQSGGGMPFSEDVDIQQVTHLADYPDLSNLNTNGYSYYVYDNRDKDAWYGLSASSATTENAVTLGHIENNEFVEDFTIAETTSLGVKIYGTFASLGCDADYPIIRWNDTPYITTRYTINDVGVDGRYGKLVEVIIDNPTFVGKTSTTSESRITAFTEKVTLKNLTRTTNLGNFFLQGNSLREINVVNCDFSNVTDINYLFYNCTHLGDIDLSIFGDMPKVTTLNSAFYQCYATKEIDLSALSGCNISNIGSAFYNCYSLKTIIGINDLNVDSTNYTSTFVNCRSLEELDISNWVVSSKCTAMDTMFQNCCSLKKLKVATSWDTSNVTSIDKIFQNCYALVFDDTLRTNIKNWKLPKLVASNSASAIFDCCYSLDGTLDLSNWTLPTTAINYSPMFASCYSINKIVMPTMNTTSLGSMFQYCYSLEEIEGLGNINTASCTSFSNMFSYCQSLKEVDLSFITDTSKITTVTYMFGYCYSLKEITFPNITYNTAKITGNGSMFRDCFNLESVTIPFTFTATISDWRNMFDNCYKLEKINTTWDLTKCGTYTPTFTNCFNLKEFTYSAAPKVAFGFGTCYRLPHDELVRIIGTLPTLTSAKILTLGAVNKAKLTADEIAVATSKNWTIA